MPHTPPPGVDTDAVREWARAFAAEAPPLDPETADLIAATLERGARRAASARQESAA